MQTAFKKALKAAVDATQTAGSLMRRQLHARKHANEVSQHDIKLELDVRCQNLIERALHKAMPQAAFLGEEGVAGDPDSEFRWVVDPIDGTVNFAYTIPHACVSIALQQRTERAVATSYEDGFDTKVGVVYDPFQDELWTALRGGPARLNGRIIRARRRRKLEEAIVSIGFAKSRESLEATLSRLQRLTTKVQLYIPATLRRGYHRGSPCITKVFCRRRNDHQTVQRDRTKILYCRITTYPVCEFPNVRTRSAASLGIITQWEKDKNLGYPPQKRNHYRLNETINTELRFFTALSLFFYKR